MPVCDRPPVFALCTPQRAECREDLTSGCSQISQSVDHARDPRLYPCGGDARAVAHALSCRPARHTPDGKFAGGPGDFRAQATQAFENLKLALSAAGATFDHVVKVTVYFTDMTHLQT
jgi:hypothetical protein